MTRWRVMRSTTASADNASATPVAGVRVIGVIGAWGTMALAAFEVERIFAPTYRRWPLVLATIAVSLAAVAVRRFRPLGRLLMCLVLSVVVSAAVVASQPYVAARSVADALIRSPGGVADLVAATWPAPTLGSSVAALSMLFALGTFLAVDLVARRRTGAALVPSLAMLGLIALVSSQAGPPMVWIVSLYVASCLAVYLSSVDVGRTPIGMGYLAAMTVVLLGVPFLAGDLGVGTRFDPRVEAVPPTNLDNELSPLARLDEWRSRPPNEVLFSSTSTTPSRWRLVGLTRYDGRTWMPADDYRLSSGVFDTVDSQADQSDAQDIAVTVGSLDAPWFPTPGQVLTVDQPVQVDGGLSGLLAVSVPSSGTVYDLRVLLDRVDLDDLTGAVAADPTSAFVDDFELPISIQQLASSVVAGAQSDLERAQRIEAYLSENFVLDADSPAGHSVAVEQLFLEQSKRGRDEQFVAAYAILASAIGLPVRVAVGFDTSANAGGTEARSSSATAWPEVNFVDFGWIQFDPIPTGDNVDQPGRGQGAIAPVESPVSAPPSTISAGVVPTTMPTDQPVGQPSPTAATALRGTTVVRILFALTVVALLVAYVAVVLISKHRRRRRQAIDGDNSQRVVGAFSTSIDLLVDLGVTAPETMTDRELAAVGVIKVGTAAHRLAPIGDAATSAVFGNVEISDEQVASSWHEAEAFERDVVKSVGRWRIVRARLSMRSLRRRWGR